MKKSWVIVSILVISIFLISIFYSVSVSAFSFNDFSNFFRKLFGKLEITGRATENLPPVATLSASPLSGTAPLTVSFTISCSDPDNNLLVCHLGFGDPSGATYTSDDGSAISEQISKIYREGNYTVKLIAIDSEGLRDEKQVTITVTKASPTPTPTPSPSASPSASPRASPSASPTTTLLETCVKEGAVCTDKYGRHSDFCSSETEINKFICQNNVCVRQVPTQCSAGMFCSKKENKCLKEEVEITCIGSGGCAENEVCENGVCKTQEEIKMPNANMFIELLKSTFKQGEQVKLK